MNEFQEKIDTEQKNMTIDCCRLWYREFQEFINYYNMPPIQIVPFLNINSPTCCVKHDINTSSVYINQLLIFCYGKINAKPIIFHEFTHVYDKHILFKNNSDNKSWGFSEYHATYVEMCCALHFSNINDYPSISLDTNINLEKNIY